MNREKLREALKSGHLSGIYAQVRRWKRRMRNEALAGTLPQQAIIVPVEELLPHARLLVTCSRLYFSLALDYMDLNTPEMDLRALACLRCADALEFESVERTRLYLGQIWSRRGDHAAARECVAELLPCELTAEERQLREQILTAAESIEPAVRPPAALDREILALNPVVAGARNLLVLGDTTGRTALLANTATYFLAARQVNGLTPADVALLPLTFDLGLASETDRQAAVTAGVRCLRWIDLEMGKPD